jgi:hypothetical protein
MFDRQNYVTEKHFVSTFFSLLFTHFDYRESGAPFGISWLGKAYFAISMLASYYLTWAFGLFKPG